MAKLHSEIRIKAVDNITGGSEGDPAKFSEGDIVYDMTSEEFKILDNGGSWQDAITGGGGAVDLASESASALQDIKYNGVGLVTLDGSEGDGKVLAWSQAENAFVPVDPDAGGGSPFVPNTSDVGLMDGHLIPDTNNVYDIGSASHKVRDMYISDASLWIGDEHKVAISGGKMRFLKRRKDRIPSGAQGTGDSKAQILGFMNELPIDQQPASFEEMELKHWKEYSRRKGGAVPFESIYNKDEDLDWEQDDSAVDSTYVVKKTQQNASYLKAFDVAVDNKAANSPQPNGSGNAYYIDGVPQAEIRLRAGTYRFYQRHFSNSGHPLGFYSEENKGGSGLIAGQTWKKDAGATSFVDFTGYSADLNSSGDLGAEGFYVELVVDSSLPPEFWYQCGVHGQMGWKVINEAAGGAGGATVADELGDISTGGATDGDALVKDGDSFVPRKVVQGHIVSVTHVADANPNTFALDDDIAGAVGGRIILDLENNSNGLLIDLDLEDLEANMFPTMNFEIFSVGTRPFDVRIFNDDGLGVRTIKSVVSSPYSLDGLAGGEQLVSVGEGQMMLLYCDGASWYYEIRSGL